MENLQQHPTEILIILFLTITFLQSGMDKILDWNGNLSYIKSHFANSPLKNVVPLLLGTILILEIAASFLMIFGIYQLLADGTKTVALLGVEICAITLLFLLAGQRLAKDYAGAMTLAVYFVTTIFGVYLLSR